MRGFGPALARHLPRRAADAYSHFHRGALRGLDRRRAPALLALSYLGLACSAARWYLVATALGVPLDVPMVVFISIVNALLSAVPITPGGFGVVEPGGGEIDGKKQTVIDRFGGRCYHASDHRRASNQREGTV